MYHQSLKGKRLILLLGCFLMSFLLEGRALASPLVPSASSLSGPKEIRMNERNPQGLLSTERIRLDSIELYDVVDGLLSPEPSDYAYSLGFGSDPLKNTSNYNQSQAWTGREVDGTQIEAIVQKGFDGTMMSRALVQAAICSYLDPGTYPLSTWGSYETQVRDLLSTGPGFGDLTPDKPGSFRDGTLYIQPGEGINLTRPGGFSGLEVVSELPPGVSVHVTEGALIVGVSGQVASDVKTTVRLEGGRSGGGRFLLSDQGRDLYVGTGGATGDVQFNLVANLNGPLGGEASVVPEIQGNPFGGMNNPFQNLGPNYAGQMRLGEVLVLGQEPIQEDVEPDFRWGHSANEGEEGEEATLSTETQGGFEFAQEEPEETRAPEEVVTEPTETDFTPMTEEPESTLVPLRGQKRTPGADAVAPGAEDEGSETQPGEAPSGEIQPGGVQSGEGSETTPQEGETQPMQHQAVKAKRGISPLWILILGFLVIFGVGSYFVYRQWKKGQDHDE